MDLKNIMNKRIHPVFSFVFLIALVLSSRIGLFTGRLEINLALQESKEGWIVLDEVPSHGQTDTSVSTDEYTYYVYQRTNSTDVIIYNNNHQIAGAFCFADINNGIAGIECVNDKTHVYLRNDRVAVLSGTTVESLLSPEEAEAQGYSYEVPIRHASPIETILTISACSLLFILVLGFIFRKEKNSKL